MSSSPISKVTLGKVAYLCGSALLLLNALFVSQISDKGMFKDGSITS